ncbi:hypothetical protein PSN45_004662 [Yamadazyma tenuis]|uniref:DUF618-domain-containing protein n=1 Tax=Candida tenuis (strain ATCC 10573 / BCRC 21748 / CBS 615 / JCM 9827 / NBRC 10315 / NRRL Y-1498 / VKM Y-70) TaxID=590646 RepID=G3B710_CANTC|nr:DUF618-domain-containing protein [Yamadazyma tenuis ATCC 10573]EGV63070.1 DUF618-domain-containing protein [Yamadazyma tenuis ATCC 10573]WEJ97114.1 hypothetical protein PSN45_004662 [Yamadazyma tenuis]
MSFSAENFERKLASLQETQDSIVSISQWVLFHHRHSKEICEIWSQFVLKPHLNSQKRLSLLYLCNDVVQQARHKRKLEYIEGFAIVLPGVFASIFHKLDGPFKPKVERVVRVWDERQVFSKTQLDAMRKSLTHPSSIATVSTPSSERKSSDAIVPELGLLNDLLKHMNELIDISQNNLNQVGIQSKKYLPNDPSVSESLPSPKLYISKLNNLEKMCQMSNQNIDSIKDERQKILTNLNNLKNIIEEGLKTDESKKHIINSKLSTLYKTRNELVEMVADEEGEGSTEIVSPSFDSNTAKVVNDEGEQMPFYDSNDSDSDSAPAKYQDTGAYTTSSVAKSDDDDNDILPTYEDDSDSAAELVPTPRATPDSEVKLPPPKRFKKSKSKSVAFSENIEIKEYDRENQTEIIKIIKSDDDQTELDEDDEYDGGLSDDFPSHHKDAIELKHEESDREESEYDPQGSGSNGTSVLDILSKLQ